MTSKSLPCPQEPVERRVSANPYLFVVGCQRSGTTMLQRMLDAHPDLAVAYDSLFLLRPIRGYSVGVDPELDEGLVEAAVTHPRFDRLGLSKEAVERASAEAETYRGFVAGIYDEYARMHCKPLAGEKSPGFCRRLPQLHGLLPEAKILHLIRDGRDVALSIRDWGKGAAKLALWEQEPVAAAALWWRRDVTRGCEDGRRLPGRIYMEVRYEELVADTESTLRSIAAHLDVPFHPSMTSYHEGKVRHKEGLSAKAAWLPPTAGLRDWRSQMSERELELFEAIAGDQLEMLGYGRGCSRVSAEAASAAAACEAWWEEHMGDS